MANLSIEDFTKMQKRFEQKDSAKETSKVNFFKLEKDGDTALVRFPYKSKGELNLATVHPVRIDGNFRTVSCLREQFDKADKCPLCAAGWKPKYKLYIKLLQYTRDENNNVVTEAKVFERSTKYVSIISDLIDSAGGDLSKYVCKIVRHNGATPADTAYTITLQVDTLIYNDTTYPADFSAFDGYEIVGNAIADMSKEDIEQLFADQKITDASVFGK